MSKTLSFYLRILHSVVGIVALWQAISFLFSLVADYSESKNALSHRLQIVLASGEIIAALLFLIPATIKIGAWSLLVIFACAAILHVAHGDFNFDALAVYAVAVLVVKSAKNQKHFDDTAAVKKEQI